MWRSWRGNGKGSVSIVAENNDRAGKGDPGRQQRQRRRSGSVKSFSNYEKWEMGDGEMVDSAEFWHLLRPPLEDERRILRTLRTVSEWTPESLATTKLQSCKFAT